MKNYYFDINSVDSPKNKKAITYKKKTLVAFCISGVLAVSSVVVNFFNQATFANQCTDATCNTTFQVNVQESLSVSLTTPSTWAEGDTGQFLRNKIGLNVSTNNANGFKAYMHSKNSTDLVNAVDSTKTIVTLDDATNGTVRSAVSDKWGYSLDDATYGGKTYGETEAGNANSKYYPMNTSDIQILDGTASGSQNIYFGTKATASQASGAYIGTVVFSVVTTNDPTVTPSTPDTPVTPSNDPAGDSVATYDPTTNRTVYTTVSSAGSGASATTTTTTQITSGDATSLYRAAQGEIHRSTSSNISDSTKAATGLAIAASTAAASGMVFFILAKRREDDEDEEEAQYS